MVQSNPILLKLFTASRYLQFKRVSDEKIPSISTYFRELTFILYVQDIATQIENIRNGTNTSYEKASHWTIFHDILNSSLPEVEKRTSRLADEGATVVSAGTVTTAWTLPVTVYYLLTNPDVLRKLKEELHKAIPDPTKSTPLVELENLPYLTGVIQEGLRLSYGICSRLERTAPDETLLFTDPSTNKAWKIPPGTPVAMTSYIIHRNPDIFPSPLEYRPERWLEYPRLDKYLVSFSKGKMQCLGINLAYAELYLMLAKLFRVYGSEEVKMDGDIGWLELFDTNFERDIDIAEDRFIPLSRRDTNGVRVLVKLY